MCLTNFLKNFVKIYKLENQIQNYKWGTTYFIPQLLNSPNKKKLPCAELWIGAHPKAPSNITDLNINLKQLIDKYPEAVLGNAVKKKFNSKLPFLLKILSAETPLSIQAHPNKKQAENGFYIENKLGKPIDAFDRNYKDDNHKPELICALTPFVAMCGFRPLLEIKRLLDTFSMNTVLADYGLLENDENKLKDFFSKLINTEKKQQKSWITLLMSNIDKISELEKYKLEIYWIKQLNKFFPGDIGVIFPLLLNLIELDPGEALYLPSGVLHAYLKGEGIEIMANSDNVLRGGLTQKYIDVHELLKIVNFKGEKVKKVKTHRFNKHKLLYKTPSIEFALTRLNIQNTEQFLEVKGPEVLLCINGKALIYKDNTKYEIKKGESVFIPNDFLNYNIKGKAEIFHVSIPIQF